jgi:hypothetical protein
MAVRRAARRAACTLAAAGLGLAPATLAAQDVIGRLPQDAVLRSLHDGQRMGPFVGWLVTGRDPVGVRAHSSVITGLRYDVFLSNPVYFSVRVLDIPSTHDVYLPAAPSTNNRAGTALANLLGFEAAFEFALSGERTWHGVQPLVNLGAGVITGAGNRFDAGGYQPGTSALYTYGLALRVPTGRNGELRADFGWLIHQVRYPSVFRTTPLGNDVALRPGGTMTPLTSNRALTVGWTWGIFR